MSSLRSQENTDELVVSDTARTTRPCHWPKEDLGKLFTLQLGKMLNKKARETVPKFPYLGNKDVQWGHFDFSDLREMHFDEQEREKFRLIPGDLLVCEGGEIGRTALWTGEFGCYYQKAIHRLRVQSPSKVDPRFILHFMRFAASHGLFTDLTSQSSIAHLTREKLARLKVPLPSLLEQRRIAAILSSVDGAIEKTQAVIDQVQVVKCGLMQELLTRGLPGRHTRFKQTAIGTVPQEWEVVPTLEVLSVKPRNGSSPRARAAPPGVPTFSIAAVRDGRVDVVGNLKYVNTPNNDAEPYRLRRGDVLVVRGNASAALLGRCGMVDQFPPGCIYPDLLMRLVPNKSMNSRYLSHIWNSNLVHGQLLIKAKTTSGTLKVNQHDVSTVLLPRPALREQLEIVNVAEALDFVYARNRDVLAAYRRVKDSLMSALLTGEVRVTPEPEAA